jgi:hypothetical protein
MSLSREVAHFNRPTATVIEDRYIQFCQCRIAAMVASGNLLRVDEDLYYSEPSRSHDELQDSFNKRLLQYVDDDLAIKLELATAHWRARGVSLEGVLPKDGYTRIREIRVFP